MFGTENQITTRDRPEDMSYRICASRAEHFPSLRAAQPSSSRNGKTRDSSSLDIEAELSAVSIAFGKRLVFVFYNLNQSLVFFLPQN